MLVGAKVCDLTEDLLWFVCGLYVEILTSSLTIAFIKGEASSISILIREFSVLFSLSSCK